MIRRTLSVRVEVEVDTSGPTDLAALGGRLAATAQRAVEEDPQTVRIVHAGTVTRKRS